MNVAKSSITSSVLNYCKNCGTLMIKLFSWSEKLNCFIYEWKCPKCNSMEILK